MFAGLASAFGVVLVLAAPAQSAFLIQIDTDGADDGAVAHHPNFSFGGDTTTASSSGPCVAHGLSGADSIFGGDGVNEPDTYVFTVDLGTDGDNFAVTPGTELAPGIAASGAVTETIGTYAVYAAWPDTDNVSGGLTTFTATSSVDSISVSLDQNSVAGDVWVLIGEIEYAGGALVVTQTAGFNSFVSMRSCGVLIERVPSVVVDGYRDAAYGDPISVQTVETLFGDGTPDGGSELDAAYAVVDDTHVCMLLTGNLQDNMNRLEVFFDSEPGGENLLSGTPEYDFFDGASWTSSNLAGLTFDDDFDADHHLFFRWTSPGGLEATFVDREGGTSAMVPGSEGIGSPVVDRISIGTIDAEDVGTNASTHALDRSLQFAIDNNNSAGVGGGSSAADAVAAAAVDRGVEFCVHRDDLGLTDGSELRIAAFINNSDHNFLSNQVLGGLVAPQGNLGGDGSGGFTGTAGVDFGDFAQDQFFTVRTDAPADSLAGYWPFEEGSGTIAYEVSGASVDGTINGASWLDDPTRGWVLDFDGVDDHVHIADSVAELSEGNFTIAAWVKIDLGNAGALLLKGDDDSAWELGERQLWFTAPGELCCDVDGSRPGFVGFGNEYMVANVNLGTGWHHLAFTWNNQAAERRIYIDGELVGLQSSGYDSNNADLAGAEVWIGRDASEEAAHDFFGQADDIAIFNAVLSQVQIQQIMSGDFSSFDFTRIFTDGFERGDTSAWQ